MEFTMKFQDLIQNALNLTKSDHDTNPLTGIKEAADQRLQQKQDTDEEIAYAHAIIDKKNQLEEKNTDINNRQISNIFYVLTHCAEAALNPKKATDEFLAIKQNDELFAETSKQCQLDYEKFITDSR